MTTYYVGLGGNDGNTGLSWAQRFLTLNGAEDEPVVAGDTVYVAPGVYRELLDIDVSGSSGSPITYIGDVTGENTDGVGGFVRITGSDDDQTSTRNYAINGAAGAGGWSYRTFRGFTCDTCASFVFRIQTDSTNWIIEDCFLVTSVSDGCIRFYGDSQSDNIVRRCVFISGTSYRMAVSFSSVGGCANAASTVENCLFLLSYSDAIGCDDVGGVAVKNCTFMSKTGLWISDALPGGYTACTINNCVFQAMYHAVEAQNVGEILEDYNTFWGNNTDRTNVNVGGNSVAYPALYNQPILLDGFQFPWWFNELSEWSQVRAIAGTGTATDDLFGMTRPATAAKKSWGALQFADISRSSTQADAGTYSAKLADAGRMQLKVPVTAVSTTISCEVYREADYAGTAPQMIIKQPGQSDDTTTDGGAAETFNTLTTTLTPAALPPYVIIELVSNNTAVAGDYNIYFDTLAVS